MFWVLKRTEPSHWGGSFEYPQHMFWLRNKNFLFWYTWQKNIMKQTQFVLCDSLGYTRWYSNWWFDEKQLKLFGKQFIFQLHLLHVIEQERHRPACLSTQSFNQWHYYCSLTQGQIKKYIRFSSTAALSSKSPHHRFFKPPKKKKRKIPH